MPLPAWAVLAVYVVGWTIVLALASLLWSCLA
jgi:hypothetical protein